MIELNRAYPALADLPAVALGQWPTPLRRLERICPRCSLFIKDDGASGPLYGGNKVRKLEYLLGQAIAERHDTVITFGVAGSNHALATAIYARQQGLLPVSILTPQRNARYVATNLLAQLSVGAQLHHYGNEAAAAAGAVFQRLRHQRQGRSVATIPGGGSSVAGTVGFVAAAFELCAQIEDGLMPVPDKIYVALGTMGTAAGLALGLRAAGLDTELIAVRVVRNDIGNLPGLRRLYEQTNRRLRSVDARFPETGFGNVTVRDDQFGERYAVFTPAGMAAKQHVGEREGLTLEGTYTAKTMAALLADHDAGQLDGQTVLYWHTYNSIDLGERIAGLDYRALPRDFHTYIERPVQPLDRID